MLNMCTSQRTALVRAQLTRQSPHATKAERAEALAVLIQIAMECPDPILQDSAANFLETHEGLQVLLDRVRPANVEGVDNVTNEILH